MSITTPERPPWTSLYKTNWDEAYQRVMAWWEGSSLDRPVVIASIAKPSAAPFQPTSKNLSWAQRDLDATYHIEAARYHLENTLFLAESAPAVSTGYGSLLWMLGAMAGAQVHYTEDTGTVWVEETPNLYEQPLPAFDPACQPYAFTLRMIDLYAQEFGFDCILGANAMVDPLTTLSMMRGPQQFCLDLIDQPEMVLRWRDRLWELFLEIVTGWRTARAVYGRREDTNWTGMWAPGDMDALQCDFSAMLSPEMFRRFALPELEREVDFYDYALWHLDGPEEIQHLELILGVDKIRGIQWADNPYAPSMNYVELYKTIRRHRRSVICSVQSAAEAIEMTKEIGKDGLALCVSGLKSEKELDDLLIALRRL